MDDISAPEVHCNEIGADKPGRGRGEGVEHRLQIERRAADDLEHVGGRGLLGERLLDLPGARLHLVEQANVLDRNHGLVGESSHHLHLARREGERLGMHKPENAFHLAVANQGRSEQ